MRTTLNIIPVCIMGIGLLALTACTTPQPVRDLADLSGANVSFLSSQMTLRAQDNQKLANLRASNMAQLHRKTLEAQAELDVITDSLRQSGETSVIETYDDLNTFAKKIADSYAQAEGTQEARMKRIRATQKPLDTKSKEMASVAKDLAAMAKPENLEKRLRFLGGFIQEVSTEVKKRQEDREAAESKAEEGLRATAPEPSKDSK